MTDENGATDVFLRDLYAGTTSLVSRSASSSAIAADAPSLDASISADGRYVAFRSRASNLVTGQDDGTTTWDVFVYDRQTGSTAMVSHTAGAAAEAPSAGDATFARISADGNHVVYVHTATTLVAGQPSADTNGAEDVFLYDRATGTSVLVSRSTAGAASPGNGFSDSPSVSDDGRYVAFRSAATDLVGGLGDNNGNADVFLFDRDTGVVSLVSGVGGGQAATGGGESSSPAISGDGSFVAFTSYSGDLVIDQFDDNLSSDVFLYNRAAGTVALVSHVSGSPEVAGDSFADSPSISFDGRHVAYASASSNLVDGQLDSNGDRDVFLYDRLAGAGESVLVSQSSAGAGTTGESFSLDPVISPDGGTVAFVTLASDLLGGVSDTNGTLDVFFYDTLSGELTLLSASTANPLTAADGLSERPAIGGRVIVFQSSATDLVNGDDNGAADVFLYDAGPNTAPTASIDTVGTPRTEGTSIAVSGSGSDPEQHAATLTYSWEVFAGGSTTPFATGTGTSWSFTPVDPGSHRIVLTVTDNRGLSGIDTADITVDPVNDPPSFTIAADPPAVGEDAGPQTVADFATDISAGPPDESGQSLTFRVVSNSQPGLFSAGPAISAAGVLTYTPAADANGTATVVVELADDGGGDDTSPTQTFTISVHAVNDPPTAGDDALGPIDEDTAITVAAADLLANDLVGPADEGGQTLRISAVGNAVGGTVTLLPDGDVRFTATRNYFGPASFTYTVTDDGTTGGAADPQADTASVSFTIDKVRTGLFRTAAWSQYASKAPWAEQLVGDFDGDGRDDTASFYGPAAEWWVSRSTGAGFETARWDLFATKAGWAEQLVGDFDGDGRDDIASFYGPAAEWWVSRSTGAGFETARWDLFATKAGWTAHAVGDFDGDGKDDIASFQASDSTLWVSLARANTTFQSSRWADLPRAGYAEFLAGDFDDDGVRDDIACFCRNDDSWWVALGEAGTFEADLWGQFTNAGGLGSHVGDFDGDGVSELARYTAANGTWNVSRAAHGLTVADGRAVPDAGVLTSDLTVSGLAGKLADVNVRLNVTHADPSELMVTLISPTGTRVELLAGIGSPGGSFTDTVLDDEAAAPITSGGGTFTGRFRPGGPLAVLDGQNPDGVWRLEIGDGQAGNIGRLVEWELLVKDTTAL